MLLTAALLLLLAPQGHQKKYESGLEQYSVLHPQFSENNNQSSELNSWNYPTYDEMSPFLEYEVGTSHFKNLRSHVIHPSSYSSLLLEHLEMNDSRMNFQPRKRDGTDEVAPSKESSDEKKSIEFRKPIYRVLGSSVVFAGFTLTTLNTLDFLQWKHVTRESEIIIGGYVTRYETASLHHLYRHRANISEGSLLLKQLEKEDSGLYCKRSEKLDLQTKVTEINEVYTELIIEEKLPIPIILKEPSYVGNVVVLSCLLNNKMIYNMSWTKEGETLYSDSHLNVTFNNSTLIITNPTLVDCGMYTCIVKNHVSLNRHSRVLLIDGILFAHKHTFIAYIIALVSNVTSLGSSVYLIFFALLEFRVYKRHVQLTAIGVFFQMLALVCMLTASILGVLDIGFAVGYRVLSGFTFVAVIIMICYITFIYLRPENELNRSFLLTKHHRNTILVYEVIAVFISFIPIYKAKQNMNMCKVPFSTLAVVATIAIVVFLVAVGILCTIVVKWMQEWQHPIKHFRK
ncbi:uncharacterized protein LOC103189488 isoform X1 [Callorhinchus milii]|uniref:uncharacterized protein LOC103189488 isoform X1 n=1 Tax=Callorhinchus milii TaxID=7868 RepID=UPI001C3F9EE9|nr:uncharacterized protein LOC103189488 isoform X1 [Callorhinchus milii]XP_042200800.1 uncharacterized protein LOC103189488 isoform X1 [Callorhinchus milii]